MNSHTASVFWKLYHQLPAAIQQTAGNAYRQFTADPLHPSLHFHRLTCDLRLWSARVTKNYRAVGAVEGDTIIWFWIGPHDEYDRKFPR